MAKEQGYCLVSQQIRGLVKTGRIITSLSSETNEKGQFRDQNLEARVQPSSFEPTIGQSVFVLDPDQLSAFLPHPNETVELALAKIPMRQRPERELIPGFELKRGHTYLMPLNEKLILEFGTSIRASPKSSIGRLFPIVRLVTDYNHCFDKINPVQKDTELSTWLLVQPTAFNLLVSPGQSLNQLRFFQGENASLSQSEIAEENRRTPFLYVRNAKSISEHPKIPEVKEEFFDVKDGESVRPADVTITDDGLQLGFDLTGTNTHGIVALKARKNPDAIDISKNKDYNAEEFFKPVLAQDHKIGFENQGRYLIASRGELRIPSHLSAELRQFSGTGITGVFHQAGFVDPDFSGDLVFEACFMEQGGVVLDAEDTRPASALEFFRTSEIPDKLYGEAIGSNYQRQLGSRPSKHFKPFDFETAARNDQRLSRDVLVHQAKALTSFRLNPEGFEPLRQEDASQLITRIQTEGFFHSRYDCEDDGMVLQPIPYVIVHDDSGKVFCYRRAVNKKYYGETKLFGKYSIGLGGHISRKDAPEYVIDCLHRELGEEVKITGEFSKPRLAGTLMSHEKPVDKVHFGLIYSVQVRGTVEPNEKSIGWYQMCSINELNEMHKRFSALPLKEDNEEFETWSRILIPHLAKICNGSYS